MNDKEKLEQEQRQEAIEHLVYCFERRPRDPPQLEMYVERIRGLSLNDLNTAIDQEERCFCYSGSRKADFGLAAKCVTWPLAHAIFLLLGKDPMSISWREFSTRPAGDPKSLWFSKQFWKIFYVATNSADGWRKVADAVNAAVFLEWAKNKGIPVPPALCKEVEKRTASVVEPLSEDGKKGYLEIIGGLLTLMLDTTAGGQRGSIYESQAKIGEALAAHFPHKKGFGKRTLEKKFGDANLAIEKTDGDVHRKG